MGRAPKRKFHLNLPSIFRGKLAVSFRECKFLIWVLVDCGHTWKRFPLFPLFFFLWSNSVMLSSFSLDRMVSFGAPKLGGGFKYFLFSPLPGVSWSNLTSIFFRWVETTNQKKIWWLIFFWIPKGSTRFSNVTDREWKDPFLWPTFRAESHVTGTIWGINFGHFQEASRKNTTCCTSDCCCRLFRIFCSHLVFVFKCSIGFLVREGWCTYLAVTQCKSCFFRWMWFAITKCGFRRWLIFTLKALQHIYPKNPDPSRKFVGLMVETSHPQVIRI